MDACRERVALVTGAGAGSGIGAALAGGRAARGARAPLADVDLARAQAAAPGVRVTAVCPGFVDTGSNAAARVARVDGERTWRQLAMFRPMRAERDAGRILDEVARTRALLVSPLHARVLWWLSRVSPSLLESAGRYTASRFGALRVGNG